MPESPAKKQTRSRALVLLALVTVAACALLATSAGAKGSAKPLYWGTVIGTQLTGEAPPWDFRALEIFEHKARKGASLLSFSSPFADCSTTPCTTFPFPRDAMETLRQHGTIPFLNWASQSVPSSLNEPAYSLAAIANGSQDEFIRGYAEQVLSWGRPFFLRFDAEMNGFWFPWSEGVNGNKPGEFVAAWRHVHDIFEEVGATNATWVWCPNVDFTRKLTPLKGLYPGSKYVDWTCLDGFNWGNTQNSAGWQSFDHVFRSTYQRVVKIAPNKPMVIGEVASEERGGSKANWIKSAYKAITAKYRKVRGVIWFDERDQGMNWPIESSRSATNAFAAAVGRSIYRPNVFSELPPGPIQPPGPNLAG